MEAYDSAVKTFLEDIFQNQQTVPVNEETVKVYRDRYQQYHQQHENLVRTWTKLEEIELMLPTEKTPDEEEIHDPSGDYMLRLHHVLLSLKPWSNWRPL